MTKGLGKLCSGSPICEIDRPCEHCLKRNEFSFEDLDFIDKFLDEHQDLMNDLRELEELEKLDKKEQLD